MDKKQPEVLKCHRTRVRGDFYSGDATHSAINPDTYTAGLTD